MNKPHKSRNSEPNEQSPRNIFEIFSCSWALENFSHSRGLRTDISQKTVVGCPCYKRLLKFQRATEKVEEAKKEIQDAFHVRPSAKRLLRPTDGNQEEIRPCLPSTNRAKASRTKQFSSANVSSTTCTSSFASPTLLAGASPLSYVRGFLSPVQEIGPNYRVFPHVGTTQDFRPPLTSTPSCSSANFSGNSREETQQVRLSVQYPSKSLKKTLHGSYQNVGKALAHGVPLRIATALMNCLPVRNHILGKVMKVVSNEVTGLSSKANPSILRKTGKKDLEKFDVQYCAKEMQAKFGVFLSFILAKIRRNFVNALANFHQVKRNFTVILAKFCIH